MVALTGSDVLRRTDIHQRRDHVLRPRVGIARRTVEPIGVIGAADATYRG